MTTDGVAWWKKAQLNFFQCKNRNNYITWLNFNNKGDGSKELQGETDSKISVGKSKESRSET